MMLCLEGEGVITNEGVPHTVQQGESFSFRPGAMHKVAAVTRFKNDGHDRPELIPGRKNPADTAESCRTRGTFFKCQGRRDSLPRVRRMRLPRTAMSFFRVHPAKLPAESAAVGGQKIRQLCAVEGDIHGVGVLLLREMPEIYEQLAAQTFSG